MSHQKRILDKLQSAMEITPDDMAQLPQEIELVRQETQWYSDKTLEIHAQKKYQDWIGGARADLLVIDDGSYHEDGNLPEYSSFSRVCWDLVAHPPSINNEFYKVLFFFCGKHKDADSGPEDLLKYLIIQFLQKATFDDGSLDNFSYHSFSRTLRNHPGETHVTLCQIFEGLIERYSGSPILIAIDGALHFEMRGTRWGTEMDSFWSLLLYQILIGINKNNKSVMKLVVTNSTAVKSGLKRSFKEGRLRKHLIEIKGENPGPSDDRY